MEKIILCLIALFISCVQSQAETGENQVSGIRENVDYRQIQNIYLRLSKTQETAGGYVVFLDGDGQFCSTQGPITLSIKKQELIGKSESKLKPIEIVKEVIAYSEQIVFEPDDFKFLTLPSGGMVYALPFNLPPDKVAVGDKVVLEWYAFKIEQEVMDF
jgi:hypothetical protein